ncbi:hypothetical protein F5B22DRAFT_85573 [Xylaria bambusicola]|uniref:uncharacterized protein n=1 Tax=Xylaria bambusicola TaxID=326684 RepID=UPI00200804D0|nr:uncharacterized protein F5B22DRAFT_85573 [Xylaria bambusicola]KAI0517957.1 hypothetical protein F5B22DRAFT_85573 [Xylaria bambusicola]
MAALFGYPPSTPPLAECGSTTSPTSGRGELAPETATTAIDAQLTVTRAVHAQEMCQAQSSGTPHSFSRSTSVDTANTTAASAEVIFADLELASPSDNTRMPTAQLSGESSLQVIAVDTSLPLLRWGLDGISLDCLPNEILMQILGFLDVCDLLTTSRINHHFRTLSLAPILHTYRLQRARILLPPLLTSPSRPTLAQLIARHIFLTPTTLISRRLARNLVAIRLSRRLPQRPSAETLVQRGVLPAECVSSWGRGPIAPALVAKRRAVEKEKLKDGLRRWVGGAWRGEVKERSEGVKKWEERAGVGRVWRLRRFWERVGQGAA